VIIDLDTVEQKISDTKIEMSVFDAPDLMDHPKIDFEDDGLQLEKLSISIPETPGIQP